MAWATLIAILMSTFFIILLGLGDSKRRRAMRIRGVGHGATLRRSLAIAALTPGLIFLVQGDAAAFLIWLGGSAVLGWAVSIALPASERP